MKNLVKTTLVLLTIFFALSSTKSAYAQEFKSDYQVDYFITKAKDSLPTLVKFSIKITNLRSDVYVKKFSINFPKNFLIHDIKASDDKGVINPEVGDSGEATKIDLEFNDPQIGKSTVNNFYLEFYQDNLFNINGNVWEVILPTVEGEKDGSYNILVHLPENSDKKISIAKPKPDWVTGNTLSWTNPSSKTIYAVFGDKQLYQADLTYHLKNPNITPAYIDIAFPPDTLYQKIYLNNITPRPNYIYLDDDGNYLGRYILGPSESKNVVFSGIIEVNASPREELIPLMARKLEQQKKYLLNEGKYWKLSKPQQFNSLTNASDIYSYVVNNLSYDYKRVTVNNERLGAEKALLEPQRAVCVEFTDLFVAIAREKGILSREIQGYGFSQDPQLRPLSLTSDVLHSWPEYFDNTKKIWLSIDPTWQNTSGIDYFTSLDLNHIVFAIHGKKSDYPLSAGMYKTEDSKDISIKAISEQPDDQPRISLNPSLPKKINDAQTFKGKLTVTNNGNTFLWNIPIKIEGKNVIISSKNITLDVLAPLQSREISFEVKSAQKNKNMTGKIDIYIANTLFTSQEIKMVPYYWDFLVQFSLILSGLIIFVIIVKIIRR